MTSVYNLTFENQTTAQAIDLTLAADVHRALKCLDVRTPSPTLVVVGGANGLSRSYMHRLEELFQTFLCPFAERHQLTVVDGGTDSGIMRLLGRSRAQTQSRFPLIGVVVKDKTYFPGFSATAEDASPLEPNHSHFVLVPGHSWGDESTWIALVADAVSGTQPSVTLLINGGDIALRQDIPNSLGSQRPVLVIAGSGRAADQVAAVLRGGVSDAQLDTLVNTGLIQAVALNEGVEEMHRTLTSFMIHG